MRQDERLRLDLLVLTAAALEPDERAALLADIATEGDDVAEEARRRLRAAAELPEGFLLTPATDLLEAACADPLPEEPPPEVDERYEIGECLGAGGMARVYRAFDRRLGRPVALKVLQARDPETPRRLLREARAQARVRHDHVLEVYDTGELDGRPYISVRHVAGGTLAAWAARAEPAGLEQKVRLAAQVAEGLHAAHREGLLHGDVKPSNVLVEEMPDGELRAWVGDFGIATEIGDAGPGGRGLAGTPEYMAPELLALDGPGADRRSDIFSLGVTLHQLLTGELPPRDAPGGSERELRRLGLPPDLAAVVGRCLAEDTTDRYPSARAVAEDLRRFLDGEVVEAYADRRAYRFARFAARHRTLIAVAGVSALLVAAALVVAAAMGVRALAANERADRRRTQAEELIGFTLLDLREKLEPVGRLDLLDGVGERAMRYFAAVPEAELTDEELARRSTALHQIGDVRMRRGDRAGAEPPLRESLALARELAARDPDDAERLFDLGQSEFWMGALLWEGGDLEGARRHFEAYHDVARRLVDLEPPSLRYRLELAYSHSNLGFVLREQGRLTDALGHFRRALAIDRRLVAEAQNPETADQWRFELAAVHNTVGDVLEELGRLDHAQGHFEADLALRRELLARDPSNQRWREFLGTSHQYLGSLLLVRGDLGTARGHLESAHEVFEELTARDPENADWRYKLAWSHLQLGRLEHAAGLRGAARAHWRVADGIARELVGADPRREDWRQLLGVARHHLAVARADEAPAGARGDALRALEILEALAAEDPDDRRAHRWLAEALLLLGDTEAARGEPAAAERAWRRGAEALAPFIAVTPESPELLRAWEGIQARLGRHHDQEETA